MTRTAFSVVICTRNRARLIERSIASVFAQAYPRSCIELIVIDNGSTDGTAAVLDRCLAQAPIPVTRDLEQRAGVSAARNRGAELARFEHVAFLDDDAAAAPRWLAAYDEAIRAHGAVVVGGRVEPVPEEGIEPPPWWSEGDIRGLFGLDHGTSVGGASVARIQWPLWLGGGNCVYTKAVLARAGGFRTDLGPTGRQRRVAEDIDLNVRLERAGVPVYYAHEAVIHHLVTADRLSRRSIWRRAYWAGRTDAAARGLVTGAVRRMSVSRFLRTAVGYARKRDRTVSICRLAYDAGYLLQSRGKPSAPEAP
jgi:glycosyltransferase involved in cell wall biosynthesis